MYPAARSTVRTRLSARSLSPLLARPMSHAAPSGPPRTGRSIPRRSRRAGCSRFPTPITPACRAVPDDRHGDPPATPARPATRRSICSPVIPNPPGGTTFIVPMPASGALPPIILCERCRPRRYGVLTNSVVNLYWPGDNAANLYSTPRLDLSPMPTLPAGVAIPLPRLIGHRTRTDATGSTPTGAPSTCSGS